MILRPPRSTRTDNSFPTRLSSDLLRFVYIDPKPDYRSISFNRHGDPVEGEEKRLPGFLTTILGALSEIPREQPIRDNVEAIEAMSRRNQIGRASWRDRGWQEVEISVVAVAIKNNRQQQDTKK